MATNACPKYHRIAASVGLSLLKVNIAEVIVQPSPLIGGTCGLVARLLDYEREAGIAPLDRSVTALVSNEHIFLLSAGIFLLRNSAILILSSQILAPQLHAKHQKPRGRSSLLQCVQHSHSATQYNKNRRADNPLEFQNPTSRNVTEP